MRIVLAVALATALFAAGLPSAERADRERNAAIAIDELEAIAAAAERLTAENDPIAPGQTPAATAVVVDVPEPTVAEGGRIRLRDDELRWEPSGGSNHTVEPSVPLRVETPIVATDRVHIRLSLVRLDGHATVFAAPIRARPASVVDPSTDSDGGAPANDAVELDRRATAEIS